MADPLTEARAQLAKIRALCDAAVTPSGDVYSIDPDDIRALLDDAAPSEWIVLSTMEAEQAADALESLADLRVSTRELTASQKADMALLARLAAFVRAYRGEDD